MELSKTTCDGVEMLIERLSSIEETIRKPNLGYPWRHVGELYHPSVDLETGKVTLTFAVEVVADVNPEWIKRVQEPESIKNKLDELHRRACHSLGSAPLARCQQTRIRKSAWDLEREPVTILELTNSIYMDACDLLVEDNEDCCLSMDVTRLYDSLCHINPLGFVLSLESGAFDALSSVLVAEKLERKGAQVIDLPFVNSQSSFGGQRTMTIAVVEAEVDPAIELHDLIDMTTNALVAVFGLSHPDFVSIYTLRKNSFPAHSLAYVSSCGCSDLLERTHLCTKDQTVHMKHLLPIRDIIKHSAWYERWTS